MNTRAIAATAAAFMLLAGCTPDTQPENETVTERRAVSPSGVVLASPTELDVGLQSCDGDAVVDELEEDAEQVRIRIVTTMVVSGPSGDCADGLAVTLEDPLDGRALIDLVSEQPIDVTYPDAAADPDSLAGLCSDMDVAWAEDEPGLDTADEAIEAFVATGDDFLADATFEGQQILYEGEVVGRLSVRSMPAGGYLVTSAEWCYPDDY